MLLPSAADPISNRINTAMSVTFLKYDPGSFHSLTRVSQWVTNTLSKANLQLQFPARNCISSLVLLKQITISLVAWKKTQIIIPQFQKLEF